MTSPRLPRIRSGCPPRRWRSWAIMALLATDLAGCATQHSAHQYAGVIPPTDQIQANASTTSVTAPPELPRMVTAPTTPGTETARDPGVERTRTNLQPGPDPSATPGSKPGEIAVEPNATKPVELLETSNAPVVPPAASDYPIDLTTALRLAEVENPQIAEARQRIVEALGLQQSARVLLVPNVNAGVTYHGHTGVYQRSTGQIYSVSNQSIYMGGGAFAVGQTTVAVPGLNISTPLTDALFEPLAAKQNVKRSEFEAIATANSVLLDAATAYYELAAAETSLMLRRETEADILKAAKLTQSYAITGQGFRSDANRAATLHQLVRRQVERAEEDAAVASARLSRRLHLDPVVRVHPQVPGIAPIELIDPRSPVEGLIQTAMVRRPEIGARTAAIETAEARLKKELARPWLPTLWLGVSGGAFGGGSNIAPPLVGNVGGRTDIDVMAYWTLQNLGLGNLAIQRRQRAQVGQAMGDRSRTITTIRREVAASLARAGAAQGRVVATARQLDTATQGFKEDLDRLKNTVGRPIELTNSLELLSQARQDHLAAILDYNRAQLQLFVSLGSPPPLERPATDPLPPAPIAYPPLPLPPGMANPAIPAGVPGPPPNPIQVSLPPVP
ncbi:TolC family protein [Singulisphaera sp. PoT]|uniref:TolC family protein n=1 Tax=Singulisphaera sp. PoT TaxID=3411797 RepID=UPI003BF4BD7A